MNDDLKAYVDGELPPDAADRLRAKLDVDPALALEAEDFRRLSAALRALPEPEPVGQAATMAALKTSRAPLVRSWSFALAGCTTVLLIATWVSGSPLTGRWTPADYRSRARVESAAPVAVVEIPAVRREAFIRFIHERGGQVRPDGDGLRAFYRSELQGELTRRFNLPEGTPLPADGLLVRFVP